MKEDSVIEGKPVIHSVVVNGNESQNCAEIFQYQGQGKCPSRFSRHAMFESRINQRENLSEYLKK